MAFSQIANNFTSQLINSKWYVFVQTENGARPSFMVFIVCAIAKVFECHLTSKKLFITDIGHIYNDMQSFVKKETIWKLIK